MKKHFNYINRRLKWIREISVDLRKKGFEDHADELEYYTKDIGYALNKLNSGGKK